MWTVCKNGVHVLGALCLYLKTDSYGEFGVSSSHALFLPEEEVGQFTGHGFMVRHFMQFHWYDRGNAEIREPAFRRAIGQYIESEKASLARVMKEYRRTILRDADRRPVSRD